MLIAMTPTIHWSDSLEKLAETMFAQPDASGDPFARECVVVGGAVVEGWLKQRYLLDRPAGGRERPLLANREFVPIHPFVNDWLAKAVEGTPIGARDPASHPYSKRALQWRIHALLQNHPGRFAPLARYIGADARVADRRRWGLAGKLAQLFDDYQNYRPEMLAAWKAGRAHPAADPDLEWQADLWRALLAEHPRSYVDEFLAIKNADLLASSGIDKRYRRLSVFHVSAMPKAYLDFFAEVAKLLPVTLYCFNPSRDFWIEDPAMKTHLRELAESGETPAWMEPLHPLLNGFGRGVQAFLANLVDWVEGQVNNEEAWGDDKGGTLLQQVQRGIRDKDAAAEYAASQDGSIQLHVCHGAMREVQVVRDLILAWFEAHPESEPRDVQVLVADFETYAPFIESTFHISDPGAHPPCVMSRRPSVGAGAVGAAFVQLLHLAESRMTAPEVMALLELDPVREACGLSVADTQALRRHIADAGVRWGADGDHVNRVLGQGGVPDTVTWRRGLDRLLAGWALGRLDETAGDGALVAAGELGDLLPIDSIEGDSASLVGVLGRFFDDLCETAAAMSRPRKVSDWCAMLSSLLDRFFRSTESAFQEIAEIRRAIRSVSSASAISGDPTVSSDVIAAAVEAELGGMAPSGNCAANAVLFSPLQTLQPTPRRLLIMMGLNEGAFPRADDFAAFDLLSRHPRYGDRSLRREDRLAFLEALMCARDRLVITYTGRDIANNAEIPPSPAVTELVQHLGERVKAVEHRLHAFHPAYFSGVGALRSYSTADYAAAAVLAATSRGDAPSDVVAPASAAPAIADASAPATPATPAIVDAPASASDAPAEGPRPLDLNDLAWFFHNPAEKFYTQVLEARLDDPQKDRLDESECFEPDALEAFGINQHLISVLVDPNPAASDDAVIAELQERTMIPLGKLGVEKTRARLDALRALLQGTSEATGVPYPKLIRDAFDAKPTPVRVVVGPYEITGGIALLSCGGGRNVAVDFRFSSIQPKRRIPSWITHLVGHAAGLRFTSVIIGKKTEKKEEAMIEEVFPPLDAEAASRILEGVLALYSEGLARPLPFAPVSSHAYAEAMRSESPTEADGLNAADKKWNDYNYPESANLYLWTVWGAAGPMADPDFGRVATTFWTPLLDAKAVNEEGAE
ncbi:MAG: exodeoxyribonuclease V subunit gamma [Kiritimatiellia bacterium]|jgi:exodeoxyribonuclease V gamma subunit